MARMKDTGFAERRSAATAAKAELLKKFAAAPKPDDPDVQARLAERAALAEQRERRKAEREAQKKAEAEAKRIAEEEEARARKEAEEKAAAEEYALQVQRAIDEAAERKAERDRRYAARKARRK